MREKVGETEEVPQINNVSSLTDGFTWQKK